MHYNYVGDLYLGLRKIVNRLAYKSITITYFIYPRKQYGLLKYK